MSSQQTWLKFEFKSHYKVGAFLLWNKNLQTQRAQNCGTRKHQLPKRVTKSADKQDPEGHQRHLMSTLEEVKPNVGFSSFLFQLVFMGSNVCFSSPTSHSFPFPIPCPVAFKPQHQIGREHIYKDCLTSSHKWELQCSNTSNKEVLLLWLNCE